MSDTPNIVKILRFEEKLKNNQNNNTVLHEESETPGEFFSEKLDINNFNKYNTEIDDKKNIHEIYKTIFENSAVAITVTDENEKVIFWNKYAEYLLNMRKDDLYLKPVRSLYPSDEWKKIRSENVRQKGMQHHLETKILKKDNGPLDVDISLSVLKDFKGNVIGSIGVIKDISERKKAERQLNKAHDLLRNTNMELEKKVEERTKEVKNLLKQKDEFIDQLGHDLKSPLTPIVNLLPKVITNIDNPKTMERLEIINRNARYIKNLVTDTLKLAKLNSKSVNLNISNIKIKNLVDDVIKDNQFIFDEYKINVNNLIKDDIYLKVDELQIREVFSNLSSNAVKFMEPGDKLTFNLDLNKDFVTISVKDTGLGMTNEQIEHIFDEFYKADESRHNIESSGLGLSICKRIIEWHGGNIWAKSPGLGEGSEFYFTIPIKNLKKYKLKKVG